MDLILIMLLTGILAPVIELTTGVPRIILGTIFLLFFPGYTLMAALFPRKDSMDGVERVALTFVMSFALVSLTGLVLNFTPWGIRLNPIFIAIASLIFIFSLAGLYRRGGLPSGEEFRVSINIKKPQWHSQGKLDKVLSICLVVAILGAIATLVYVITEPKTEEAFTDFYMLGSEGMMEDYPHDLILGEQAEITLGIINHENQPTSYAVTVMFDGDKSQEIGPLSLADEEEWRQKITLIPASAGENQRVEFQLYKEDGSEPHLTLHLWLDVEENK